VAPAVPVVKPRNRTELQRARTFISETLSGEPMLTTTVEELAVEAKVRKRTTAPRCQGDEGSGP
jgi:hypothetical protein